MSTEASPSYRIVSELSRTVASRPLLSLFSDDPARFARLSVQWDGWLVDLSKERITPEAIAALLAHARDVGIEGWIAALFSGEKVNLTERRAALHTVLRQRDDTPVRVDGHDVLPDVRHVQARMHALADAIHAGARTGATGQPFRYVVNIGIGGSDLGPLLVCDALALLPHDAASGTAPDVGFVSNVDPEHIVRALQGRDAATTLFIVTSKTFTTQETLANADAARAWLRAQLGPDADLGRHFLAVTSNTAAAERYGIAKEDIYPLWDWVGGRYSLWSAVGLAIALRLGWPAFTQLLAGAYSMDQHFRTAPLERNLPMLLGALGFWNARLLGRAERVVVPYAQALARLPAYLQQLVLESNGKSVTRDGRPAPGPTANALWGEPGTNGQHAFFQWLHQGTREAPVEFIVPLRAAHPVADQQTLLVANAIAQAQALLVGRRADAIRDELVPAGAHGEDLEMQVAARVCPGNRASTMIMMPELDAYRLGQLLALYEHRTFVEAMLFGINPFDQFGVELGKTLAKPIIAAIRGEASLPGGIDASTTGLVAHVRDTMRT
ncbi:MAG TPA: glucose-6-phosphate isomerase [Casimicrobiaceae bacterium]|nr:glucose-6-phosphate isomerase [Casimicrobiaceae bacterium]